VSTEGKVPKEFWKGRQRFGKRVGECSEETLEQRR
jgi:hypothetical protein